LSDAAKSSVAASAVAKYLPPWTERHLAANRHLIDIVTMPAANIESGSPYSDAGSGSMGPSDDLAMLRELLLPTVFGDLSGAVAEVGGEDAAGCRCRCFGR
jgi:hypothetical protein